MWDRTDRDRDHTPHPDLTHPGASSSTAYGAAINVQILASLWNNSRWAATQIATPQAQIKQRQDGQVCPKLGHLVHDKRGTGLNLYLKSLRSHKQCSSYFKMKTYAEVKQRSNLRQSMKTKFETSMTLGWREPPASHLNWLDRALGH